MISWTVAAPAIGAAFVASLVEAVEAFTSHVAGVATGIDWLRGLLGGLEGVVGFKQRLAPRNAAEVEICGR